MSKLRSDSYFAQISPDSKEMVDNMLFGRKHSYEEIQQALIEAGEDQISIKGIAGYYTRHIRPLIWQGRQQAARLLNEMKTGEVSEATHKLIGEMLFDLASRPDAPIDEVVKLYQTLLKHEKLQQDDRRIRLLEVKAEQADEAKKVTESRELTDEERMARYRQIFGMS